MAVDRTTPEFKARKAAYDKARRLANPERKRELDQAYYAANRAKVDARSRGGLHTADNVVPACMPCNRRKGRMTALEYSSAVPNRHER